MKKNDPSPSPLFDEFVKTLPPYGDPRDAEIAALRQQLAECQKACLDYDRKWHDTQYKLDECEREIERQRDAYAQYVRGLTDKLATVTAERDELVAALSSIRECVFAAMFEGLQDRLAEEENTDAGSLYDLVIRRLLPMDAYAEAALAKLGADETGEV